MGCSVLQCVAVCCSVLPSVAVCCRVPSPAVAHAQLYPSMSTLQLRALQLCPALPPLPSLCLALVLSVSLSDARHVRAKSRRCTALAHFQGGTHFFLDLRSRQVAQPWKGGEGVRHNAREAVKIMIQNTAHNLANKNACWTTNVFCKIRNTIFGTHVSSEFGSDSSAELKKKTYAVCRQQMNAKSISFAKWLGFTHSVLSLSETSVMGMCVYGYMCVWISVCNTICKTNSISQILKQVNQLCKVTRLYTISTRSCGNKCHRYKVALVSRIDKTIGLFCKRAL